MEGSIKNFNKHLTYYPSGKLKEEGSFYIDQIGFDEIEEFKVPVGRWKGWYEDGREEYIEEFNEKGENDGIFVYWNKNGIKTREWYYKNGEKDGPFKIWFENGKKSKETNYKMGKKDGLTYEWFENGILKMKTNFVDGLKNGTHVEWNENGVKLIEGKFDFGFLTSKKQF